VAGEVYPRARRQTCSYAFFVTRGRQQSNFSPGWHFDEPLVVLGADFEIPVNIPQALYRRASFGAIETVLDQIDQRLPGARQAGMSLRHQFRVPIQ
jgi:hypothetical protein